MRGKDKFIEVKEHKAAYFVDKYRKLSYYPIKSPGVYEKETEIEVEQSPISYRKTHEQVLEDLGFTEEDILSILKNVKYY